MALRTTRTLLTRVTQPSPARQTAKTKPTTILEVERKFRRLTVPTLTDICATKNNDHYNPNFRSVLPFPTRTIHDIYYDAPDHTLCTSGGAWIRRRNGEWQAKVKRGGDFVNSRFEELRGVQEIRDCIRSILGGGISLKQEGENFGLERLAEFVTTREAWLVDGEFKVVRDRMDFGHEVGEVELQVEVPVGDAEEEKGVLIMEEMDRRIEEFMKNYAWAWECGEAVGKLTAYFEMVRRKNGGV
ncbi:CYTH-like domain-containing protein [Achaetomium macrosporum]|uniref:Thiamine-triphosphatase n=1 Tax=Achaetomium macrosporum TaxID=79813 RepID=A0AAN7HH94_9PEZI|nr:CYTH-like domain-containing protein [Achaetomium macrosporum]